jgi:heme-degrading monooxygenase HmoA
MVRVIIERQLAAGREAEFHQAMRELRSEAVRTPGYISGETLSDADDRRHCIIISTWRSRQDWDAWSRSVARRQTIDRIRGLLLEDERVTVLAPE